MINEKDGRPNEPCFSIHRAGATPRHRVEYTNSPRQRARDGEWTAKGAQTLLATGRS
jgi:hypothetical protein